MSGVSIAGYKGMAGLEAGGVSEAEKRHCKSVFSSEGVAGARQRVKGVCGSLLGRGN